MSKKNAERDAALLKQYFDTNPRFEFVNLVGHGNFGSACRVRYNDPKNKIWKYFLVKKSFSQEGANDALRTEKKYLRRLRGGAHIVRMLDIEDNPLNKSNVSKSAAPGPSKSANKLPDIDEEWMILEWLEHGTVGEFIMKARNMKVERLPNRLLWRFFYCLVRGCIAMAWPPNRSDDKVENEKVKPGVPESRLVHNDLHDANVLLGEPPTDPEHTISPIIKIIDFGIAGEWAWRKGQATAVQSNIYEIGRIMVLLIGLWSWTILDVNEDKTSKFRMTEDGPEIETDAVMMLPLTGDTTRFPHLDPLLGRLVCACLATDHSDRPTLQQLSADVAKAVSTRGASFYPGVEEEQNDSIAKLWREIAHFAGTQEKVTIVLSS
ncbi:kinase-like protein [Hypoxylon sp. FL0890]|nr:kinase-like protein [Hypoxylon sp. FL0890]